MNRGLSSKGGVASIVGGHARTVRTLVLGGTVFAGAFGLDTSTHSGVKWQVASVYAQANPSARADAAEALFLQAQQLGQAGKWAQACEKFAASSALEPGVGTLLYLGDCYERLDRYASASKVFSQAAALAAERGDKDRQHVAEVRAAALGPRAPRLEVRVSGAALVPGLQVTFNGIPLSSERMNSPQPRDAGVYEVEVSAPGFESFKSRIELHNGDSVPAILTIPQLVEQQAAVEPSSRASSRQGDVSSDFFNQSTIGLLIGGAGIVMAGSAGVLTAFAQSTSEDSKRFCGQVDVNGCSQRGVELRGEAFDMAAIATAVGIASGLALAGGTYLYITADGMESGSPEAATLHVAGTFDLF